jgi:ATP-dependent DNA helicase DinG
MDTRTVLGPDGLVAAKLAGFESRPQQLERAEAVADAIDRRKQLRVEAGTGLA